MHPLEIFVIIVLCFLFGVIGYCIGKSIISDYENRLIQQCKQYGVAVVDDNFVQCQVIPPQPIPGV